MLRCLILLVVSLSISLSPLSAQTLSQIEVLTTEDGLPFRDVSALTQDSLGFMWFGTSQGLLKYDGYSFKIYNNNPNNPNFIQNEQLTEHNTVYQGNNNLWFVANNSLFKLNIQTDSVFEYTQKQGIKGDVIELHIDHKKHVWIVTDNHWISKKDDTYQYLQRFDAMRGFEIKDSVRRGNREFTRLTSDRNNHLWWLTQAEGSLAYTENGKRLQNNILAIAEGIDEIKNRGTSFFDHNNQHYYFPNNKGIIRYDTLKNKWEPILNESKSIHRAIEDNEGNIWFSGETILYRKDRFGNFTNFTHTVQEQLDFTRITDFFIDTNGLLWLTTNKGILKLRIKPKIFKQLFKSNEKDWGNAMRSIVETKDGSIIGLCERDKKLMVFSPDSTKQKELKLWGDYSETTFPLHGARFFCMDLNKEYAYTVNKSLVKIRMRDGHATLYPEFSNRLNITGPNPIITLKDGRLLFGFTLAKLTLYNPETGESELVFKKSIPKNYLHFRFFLESKTPGIIWVGSVNDGLFKINLNGTIEARYHLNSDPPLNKNNVMVIHENKDESLWIGTFGGGLTHIIPDAKKTVFYGTPEGLANNNVVGILPYQEEYLLVSTYDGLSFFNTTTGTFQNFFVEDGLTHNEFNYTSFFKDSNENYYFGGMNGVNMFNPKQLTRDSLSCNIIATALKRYNSKSNAIQERNLSYESNPSVEITPYDQYFQVNWTIPNYFKNSENQYYTKLEGFENTWFSQGTNPYVRYNKLPAGTYTLHVKGADFSGTNSKNVLKIPILVKPIFYKTWWFMMLVALVILLIIYALFQVRVKQLVAIEQLRVNISSDLHDNLGSMLSGLAMQSELLELNAEKENKSRLHKIAATSREAISQMRDLVWSIDSRRERTADLLERMEELAEELLFPKNISFHLENDNLTSNKKLSITAKQHLFFIYKEAITNIIRHTNAKNVWVSFTNKDGFGVVIIRDDGTLQKANKSSGFGLLNMKLRAKKMNATLQFKKENGFEIHLKLPFKL
jgi:ligand-binding sensor domain-containing protein/two-component sensor histidine kinase